MSSWLGGPISFSISISSNYPSLETYPTLVKYSKLSKICKNGLNYPFLATHPIPICCCWQNQFFSETGWNNLYLRTHVIMMTNWIFEDHPLMKVFKILVLSCIWFYCSLLAKCDARKMFRMNITHAISPSPLLHIWVNSFDYFQRCVLKVAFHKRNWNNRRYRKICR